MGRSGFGPSLALAYDSGSAVKEFSWAGDFDGFSVCLVLTSRGRLANVQRLIAAENLDFVLLAALDDLKGGSLNAHVWHTHDGRVTDILGRAAS